MFYYHKSYQLLLADFGIEIPIKDSKILKCHKYITEKFPSLLSENILSILEPKLLETVHNKNFIEKVLQNPDLVIQDTFELVNSDGSYNRYNPNNKTKSFALLRDSLFYQANGTISACLKALETGFAYNLGGGFHHAMSFTGRGFCLINDLVLAARYCQNHRDIKKVWIIDVDAHKGDGTAELAQNDSSINTYSIHMAHGWPLDSEKYDHNGQLYPWFISSDMDVPIDEKKSHHYVDELAATLKEFSIQFQNPDLAIIVQGSDPYEKDELPSSQLLKLSKSQMLDRDIFIYNFLKNKNIPQAYVMSGGYGKSAHEIYLQFFDYLYDKL